MTTKKTTNHEIVPFKVNEVTTLEVMQMNDDVWLTAEQIAKLFSVQRSAITKHINNIYNDEELDKKSTCSILEHMGANGQIYQSKQYNLDMIVALGYRVKCKIAIRFRQWATQVIKNHLKEKYEHANRNELDKTERLQKEERAKEIKNLMKLNGISCAQIANDLGISTIMVSYLIHGKHFNIRFENWIDDNLFQTKEKESSFENKINQLVKNIFKGDFESYKKLQTALTGIAAVHDFKI